MATTPAIGLDEARPGLATVVFKLVIIVAAISGGVWFLSGATDDTASIAGDALTPIAEAADTMPRLEAHLGQELEVIYIVASQEEAAELRRQLNSTRQFPEGFTERPVSHTVIVATSIMEDAVVDAAYSQWNRDRVQARLPEVTITDLR